MANCWLCDFSSYHPALPCRSTKKPALELVVTHADGAEDEDHVFPSAEITPVEIPYGDRSSGASGRQFEALPQGGAPAYTSASSGRGVMPRCVDA